MTNPCVALFVWWWYGIHARLGDKRGPTATLHTLPELCDNNKNNNVNDNSSHASDFHSGNSRQHPTAVRRFWTILPCRLSTRRPSFLMAPSCDRALLKKSTLAHVDRNTIVFSPSVRTWGSEPIAQGESESDGNMYAPE